LRRRHAVTSAATQLASKAAKMKAQKAAASSGSSAGCGRRRTTPRASHRRAANLTRQVRRLAIVVLPQFQAVARDSLHQMFATPLEQTRIRRMRDRLVHDGRVDDYTLHACSLDHTGTFRRLDRLGQQFFDTGFAQPVAPARQARWIAGGSVCRYVSPVNI